MPFFLHSVFACPKMLRKKALPLMACFSHFETAPFFMESGNVLLSQVVSNQVPSALKGLTSVFGMGTGGSLSPLSPENCEGFVQSLVFLVSAPSLYNRSFHLGDSPHISRFIFYCAYPENRTSRLLTSCITSFQFSLWSQLNSLRSSPRPISIIKLQMLPLFHR